MNKLIFSSEIDRNYLCVTPQLRSFHAVASAGGFNAAANELNITPADADRAGRSARSRVRRRAVHRRRAGTRELTDAGRDLLAITTRMFARGAGSARLSRAIARAAHRPPRDRRSQPLSRHRDAGGIPAQISGHRALGVARQLGRRAAASCSTTSIDVAVLALYGSRRAGAADPATGGTRSWCSAARTIAWRAAAQFTLRDLEGERMIVREQGSTTRRAFTAALGGCRRHAERRDGDRQPRRRSAKP